MTTDLDFSDFTRAIWRCPLSLPDLAHADDALLREVYHAYRTEWLVKLLAALHAADSFTRDDVAYTLFCRLLSLEIISPEELAWLLEQLVSDHHLFAGIGEVGDDTVFGRSFSVLVAGHVLDVDAAHRVLDVDLVHGAIARILWYAVGERDRRGFVPSKGWAHSAAHTADALGACARHPAASEGHWQAVLVAIASVADTNEPLIYLEDERLALAVRSVFQRTGWRPELWDPWIVRFDRPSEWTPEDTVRHANRVHLLHAARCCLVRESAAEPLVRAIDARLMEICVDGG